MWTYSLRHHTQRNQARVALREITIEAARLYSQGEHNMLWLNRIGIILEFLSFWFAAPEILGE